MKTLSLALLSITLCSSAFAGECVFTDANGKETVQRLNMEMEDGPFALGTLKFKGIRAQVERGPSTNIDENGTNRSMFLSVMVSSGNQYEGEVEVNPEATDKVEMDLQFHKKFKKISCSL